MAKQKAGSAVAKLAGEFRALSPAEQLEVLRRSLRYRGRIASDEEFRAAVEKVLRDDREILESLSD